MLDPTYIISLKNGAEMSTGQDDAVVLFCPERQDRTARNFFVLSCRSAGRRLMAGQDRTGVSLFFRPVLPLSRMEFDQKTGKNGWVQLLNNDTAAPTLFDVSCELHQLMCMVSVFCS